MKTLFLAGMILISGAAMHLGAQTKAPQFEGGLTVGTVIYQGDLTPYRTGAVNTPGFNFNVFGNYLLNPAFLLRGGLMAGTMRADDALYEEPSYRQQRNLNFNGQFGELTALLLWNPAANNGYERLNKVYPYLFAGGGVSFMSITRDWSRFNREYFLGEPGVIDGLAADIAYPLPRIIPVVPVGIGARYFINEKLSIIAEGAYRFTETDYLDGFSRSANPDLKDHYTTVNIGLVYRFGAGERYGCPVMIQ